MHDAVTTPRRPVRPLTHLLAALGMAAALLPGALLAHQGADHASALAAAKSSATATPTQVQGRVGAIVVTNRMTAQQHVHPVLEATNGTRYLLKNAGALPTGATAAVTGRVDGQVLWSESTRTLAAPPAKSAVQRAALTGTLRMFHVDYQDGRPAEFGYSLVPDSGKQNIVEFGTLLPMLENGMRATVAGPVNAQGYIAVDTIDILAPPVVKPPRVTANGAGPPVGVTTGYLTMPLQYPNNAAAPWTYNAAPFTVATITTNVYGAAPALSAAEYYKEVSFGAQLLSGKVSNAGGAWLKATVARPTACGTSAELNAVLTSIETQADAAATAVGDIPGNYTGVLYVVDALPCGWAGLGYIGWERAYTKGTSSLGVVGHELGHNFGLYHAGSLDCAANVIAASGCSVTEYGDPFDIMGNIRSMHFNAYQKQLLGYIAGSTVATHSAGSTTYTLGPIELAGQSQYAVKVPTSNTKRTYWLEFRQPIGFDSALASFPNNGAQVRLARPFENNSCGGCTGTYDDTQFLDMTPSTGAFTDGALVVNQSYTDSTYNIVIDVLAATSSALTVKVTIGGTQTGSTTTLASGTNPSTQAQSVTFTATVTGAAPTGTVAFRDAGTAISGCTAVALTGTGNTRTAACATSALAVGVHSIVADYSGDTGNTASSSTALSQSVKAASATTLATSGSPVTAGTSVTFTASVTGSAPTGTVAFTSDGAGISGCSAISLAGAGNTRTAACTTSSLAAGTHAIVASYAGNSANGASTSAPLSQVVSAATTPTTTTLASGTNPSVAGATVTFTASVTGTAPTGAVAFTADGNGIAGCGAVSLAGSGNTRTAACTTSALAAGVRAIVASYGGDTGNASSSSAPLSQTVKAASTTTLATSGSPVVAGASVTFTASVTGSAPTGAVAFTSDGVTISGCGAVALTGSGGTRTSVCTTSSLATGTHAIVASYAGDSANGASSSAPLSQVVSAATTPTTTTLASGTNPSVAGATVTFTASVTGTAPTGAVAFTADGNGIAGCGAVGLAGSGNTRTAACTTSALAAGVRAIVASYGGDTGNASSSSAPLSQTVKAASTTTVATSGTPVVSGTSVTFTASVTGSAPTGAVAFTSDGVTISGCGAIALAGSGGTRTSVCTTSSLTTGTHAIVASYAGDAANVASSSAPLSQVISAVPATPTTTTVASGTNPSVAGATVTFTASITGAAPTGAVAFTADGAAIAGCGAANLAGSGNTRTAACTTSALAAGVRAIVASYGGDTGNASSSSAPLSQTVKAASTTTVATSGTPVVSGTSVTFTASVAGSAPTGAVAFTSDGVTISGCGAVGLTGSGDTRTSACTTASLAIGAHAIVATYAGDAANANSASAPLSQVISAVAATPTTTNLASGTNPSVTGAPVTFTASVTGAAPTGTVAFTADGATIAGCGAASLAGSGNTRTAACTTGALAVGTRAIVAGYGGDAGNLPSASSTLLQAVNGTAAVATRTTVTSARNPSPLGIAIPLTATIASNPPVTGGTVTFTAHGATISGCANVAVTAAGNARRAVCPAANLASGAHSIVASYSGDATGLASVSPVFSQVVPFPTIGNTLQFANATLAVNETAGSVAVMVTRIGDASAAAHASYATAAGTATANADFTAASGTLTWADGDASPRFIVIPIAGDALVEPGETFNVSLSNPVGATLGAASTTTVTIVDDESAAASMPGTATVVQHPYGALTVQGGTLSGSTITNLQSNAVIQLGNVAGAPGSFAKIDFQGLDIGAGNTLTIRAGAPGQTVYVVNAGGAAATIAGTLQAQAGAGAPAPYLYVQSPNGLATATSGAIRGPAGLTVDTLAGSWTAGQPLVNQGSIDGAASLQLFAAKVNGGGAFRGNAIVLATFGNLNNPVNGAHFLSNGLNLHPGSGNALDLTLAAFGGAPQFMNLMLHGDATIGMPSAWPNGSALPPNNRPVMPGETRAAGVPDPAYGGGSMIVQATGKLTLEGGASGDFVFPGSVVLRSAGALDVKGTTIDNAWTTSGATYQGVFLEAASVTDSAASARIAVRTNDRNWVNLMPRALVPVNTWTLQRQGNGTAQFQAADGVAPHLNFFSITTEAGAAGACYTCLVNTEVIDFTVLP